TLTSRKKSKPPAVPNIAAAEDGRTPTKKYARMANQPNPNPPARANVLGVGLSVINLDSAVAAVTQALERKQKGYICVTGVHGVSEAQHDPAFRAILNHSFLTTPDGMPMVWMGRF